MEHTVTEISYEQICEKQRIAKTIRQQIGIQTLMACGAREYKFLGIGLKGISFKVNHGRKRQYLTVLLTSMDDYNIELRKIAGHGEIVLERAMGVYCDQLSEIIYHMVNK